MMQKIQAGNNLFVGLTGGIGSGKSTVARHYEHLHPILYSDSIARKCMIEDNRVRAELIKYFGQQAYISDGTLNREWLAEVVFHDNKKLKQLNAIVHPPTRERMQLEAEELFNNGASMVFVESALIYEAKLEEDFDYILSVLADPEIAVQRIVARENVSADVVRSRMRNQLGPEEKAALADFTIRNNGTVEELLKSADIILSILGTLRRRRP